MTRCLASCPALSTLKRGWTTQHGRYDNLAPCKTAMSAREHPELQRITVVLPAGPKGKGLFARVDIARGTVIARMRQPARMKRSEIKRYLRRHPRLPHDFCIYAARSTLIFYDASWSGENRTPVWYRLNHSSHPNTAPTVLDTTLKPRDQEVVWVTTKSVRQGQELCFEYENPDPDWD